MHSFADKMFTRHRHHQSAHRAGMSVVSMSMAMAIELCGHSPNARHEHEHEKNCAGIGQTPGMSMTIKMIDGMAVVT